MNFSRSDENDKIIKEGVVCSSLYHQSCISLLYYQDVYYLFMYEYQFDQLSFVNCTYQINYCDIKPSSCQEKAQQLSQDDLLMEDVFSRIIKILDNFDLKIKDTQKVGIYILKKPTEKQQTTDVCQVATYNGGFEQFNQHDKEVIIQMMRTIDQNFYFRFFMSPVFSDMVSCVHSLNSQKHEVWFFHFYDCHFVFLVSDPADQPTLSTFTATYCVESDLTEQNWLQKLDIKQKNNEFIMIYTKNKLFFVEKEYDFDLRARDWLTYTTRTDYQQFLPLFFDEMIMFYERSNKNLKSLNANIDLWLHRHFNPDEKDERVFCHLDVNTNKLIPIIQQVNANEHCDVYPNKQNSMNNDFIQRDIKTEPNHNILKEVKIFFTHPTEEIVVATMFVFLQECLLITISCENGSIQDYSISPAYVCLMSKAERDLRNPKGYKETSKCPCQISYPDDKNLQYRKWWHSWLPESKEAIIHTYDLNNDRYYINLFPVVECLVYRLALTLQKNGKDLIYNNKKDTDFKNVVDRANEQAKNTLKQQANNNLQYIKIDLDDHNKVFILKHEETYYVVSCQQMDNSLFKINVADDIFSYELMHNDKFGDDEKNQIKVSNKPNLAYSGIYVLTKYNRIMALPDKGLSQFCKTDTGFFYKIMNYYKVRFLNFRIGTIDELDSDINNITKKVEADGLMFTYKNNKFFFSYKYNKFICLQGEAGKFHEDEKFSCLKGEIGQMYDELCFELRGKHIKREVCWTIKHDSINDDNYLLDNQIFYFCYKTDYIYVYKTDGNLLIAAATLGINWVEWELIYPKVCITNQNIKIRLLIQQTYVIEETNKSLFQKVVSGSNVAQPIAIEEAGEFIQILTMHIGRVQLELSNKITAEDTQKFEEFSEKYILSRQSYLSNEITKEDKKKFAELSEKYRRNRQLYLSNEITKEDKKAFPKFSDELNNKVINEQIQENGNEKQIQENDNKKQIQENGNENKKIQENGNNIQALHYNQKENDVSITWQDGVFQEEARLSFEGQYDKNKTLQIILGCYADLSEQQTLNTLSKAWNNFPKLQTLDIDTLNTIKSWLNETITTFNFSFANKVEILDFKYKTISVYLLKKAPFIKNGKIFLYEDRIKVEGFNINVGKHNKKQILETKNKDLSYPLFYVDGKNEDGVDIMYAWYDGDWHQLDIQDIDISNMIYNEKDLEKHRSECYSKIVSSVFLNGLNLIELCFDPLEFSNESLKTYYVESDVVCFGADYQNQQIVDICILSQCSKTNKQISYNLATKTTNISDYLPLSYVLIEEKKIRGMNCTIYIDNIEKINEQNLVQLELKQMNKKNLDKLINWLKKPILQIQQPITQQQQLQQKEILEQQLQQQAQEQQKIQQDEKNQKNENNQNQENPVQQQQGINDVQQKIKVSQLTSNHDSEKKDISLIANQDSLQQQQLLQQQQSQPPTTTTSNINNQQPPQLQQQQPGEENEDYSLQTTKQQPIIQQQKLDTENRAIKQELIKIDDELIKQKQELEENKNKNLDNQTNEQEKQSGEENEDYSVDKQMTKQELEENKNKNLYKQTNEQQQQPGKDNEDYSLQTTKKQPIVLGAQIPSKNKFWWIVFIIVAFFTCICLAFQQLYNKHESKKPLKK